MSLGMSHDVCESILVLEEVKMYWKFTVAAFCTFLLASISFAQDTAAPKRLILQTTDRSVYETNLVTYKAFAERLISIDYFEMRMGDVLATLQNDTGINYRLNETAADNNLDDETLITLELKNTRLETTLDVMLESFQCTWTIQDGIVEIISVDASQAVEWQGWIVFDCADLLGQIDPVTVTRRVPPLPQPDSPGFTNGRKKRIEPGGGVFNFYSGQEDKRNESPKVRQDQEPNPSESADSEKQIVRSVEYVITIFPREQLANLVTTMIDPRSWETNGGYGQITSVNQCLVVRQNYINLRKIERLLEQMRAVGLNN